MTVVRWLAALLVLGIVMLGFAFGLGGEQTALSAIGGMMVGSSVGSLIAVGITLNW